MSLPLNKKGKHYLDQGHTPIRDFKVAEDWDGNVQRLQKVVDRTLKPKKPKHV